jgi:hypothetical protein
MQQPSQNDHFFTNAEPGENIPFSGCWVPKIRIANNLSIKSGRDYNAGPDSMQDLPYIFLCTPGVENRS